MPSFYDSEVEEQKRSGKVTNVALPILAALEAIGTSIATKGRNPTSNALGIYKDVQSGREAALERALGRDKDAASSARDAKLLGFQEAAHTRAQKDFDYESTKRSTEAENKRKAIERLLGTPAEMDPTGKEIRPAVPGIPDLTDLDKAAIAADPVGWMTQKLKPLQTQLVLGNDMTYQPVVKATGKTPEGKTVTAPPPRPTGGGVSKPPAGYRNAADGSLEFIPGGPADPAVKAEKPPTEDQSKAANFARRMELALSDLNELEGAGFNRASTEASARSSSWTPNFLNSKEGQRYSNAEKNFASANLRKESGAVIGVEEMAQQEALYFPRHGDSPETIEQKKRNRQQAYEGMKAAAGNQFNKIPSMVPVKAPPAATPAIQALISKARAGDTQAQQYLQSKGVAY